MGAKARRQLSGEQLDKKADLPNYVAEHWVRRYDASCAIENYVLAFFAVNLCIRILWPPKKKQLIIASITRINPSGFPKKHPAELKKNSDAVNCSTLISSKDSSDA
jgi:hypothetical protein